MREQVGLFVCLLAMMQVKSKVRQRPERQKRKYEAMGRLHGKVAGNSLHSPSRAIRAAQHTHTPSEHNNARYQSPTHKGSPA